ncbi:MAG: nucleotidyltransferase domain-containing protein [Candidatus Woesearchaeota archaeon]
MAGKTSKQPKNLSTLTKTPQQPTEHMQALQKKIEEFQKKLLKKFEGYISGIALLPKGLEQQEDLGPTAQKKELLTQDTSSDVQLLVLIDDTDTQKMSKEELKQRLTVVIDGMAKEVDETFKITTLIYSELWQYCFDAKYDILQTIAMSTIVYDTGMLSAVKIAEIHKNMTLKKFEKYIVSYVLAGSLVQGKANAESDIDVFIVIDDTDVKRMSRAELKDKLRAIILNMGVEAGQITGIKNKINIQTYILTDFWDSIKEANPVIFTFLRDGVPFFDRGIFMPWKQLLRLGKIRPSMEAIDLYMNSGAQVLDRVKIRLKEIALEDFFYATLTPSQAVLMMYGITPPTPKETPGVMSEVFVKKEKMMDEKYVKTLEKIVKVRKDLEHGKKTSVTGKEIDELFEEATAYRKGIEELASTIEKRRNEQDIVHIYDTIVSLMREVFKAHSLDFAKQDEFVVFEKHIIKAGHIPQRYLRSALDIKKTKEDYDKGKLGKVEVEKLRNQSSELIKYLSEYVQRKRAMFIERIKLRIKHGEAYSELLVLDNVMYVVQKDSIHKVAIKQGVLQKATASTQQDVDKALEAFSFSGFIALPHNVDEWIKDFFGKDAQVLL